MTEHEEVDPGFKVTIKDVWLEVRGLKEVLDGRLRKVEAQIAAQWVVVGIIIVAVGTLAVRGITI